jgi:beta-1,4-mannosyl-glycoprotein beta-1,4-N-acetylglucosaminyltransferase
LKIFDCFLFFDELDLLEIRLNVLYPYIDYFVIVESGITFQGNAKAFNLENSWDRFVQYSDKIIYLKINSYDIDFSNPPFIDDPKSEDELILNRIYKHIVECPYFDKKLQFWWGNDFFQRECLWRALNLIQPADGDLILISDADEIPNPSSLLKFIPSVQPNVVHCFRQHEFCYYLNYYHNSDWFGTCAFLFRDFKYHSLNSIRFSSKRNEGLVTSIVENGGWHFTSIGGIDKIQEKIMNWGHKEYNLPFVIKAIKYNVIHGYDIFRRPGFGKLQLRPTNDLIYTLELSSNFIKFPQLLGPEIIEESPLIAISVSAYFFIQQKWTSIIRRF